MIYRVTAHLKSDRDDEYLIKLSDSTFKSQCPDGGEIVDAMKSVSAPDCGGLVYANDRGVGQFCTPNNMSYHRF